MRTAIVVGVLVVSAVAIAAPKEVRRDIGAASFSVPPGFTVREGDAADHLAITKADARYYCILSVFAPRPVDPEPNAEFVAEWNNVLAKVAAAPKPTTRKLGTRTVREAGVQGDMEGTNLFAAAHIMDLDQQIISVYSFTTNAKALDWCRPDLDAVLASVRLAAPATAPVPTEPAAKSATVTMANLVGKWGNNGAATMSYVDSNGYYSGSSTTFFGEWYTIKADGSYTFSFQGRANNHTVRETGAGKVSFSGDLIILEGTREGSRTRQEMHLLGYQAGKDGSAVLLLLDGSYPLDSANIGLYKQAWIREPTKKK